MLIKFSKRSDVKPSEITSHSTYLERRSFLKGGAAAAIGSLLPWGSVLAAGNSGPKMLEGVVKSPFSTADKLNSYEDITSYNNFYEFGTGKTDPAENAQDFNPRPWMIEVDGHCDKPGVLDFEDMLRKFTLEERIYRLRCVEAWSMVVPWVGISLADVLKTFQPNAKAKYVEFTTLFDPAQMPGQKYPIVPWPYREGLRMDEAMNPLSILAVGIYGKEMPGQNGAPVRLVVPWKYGFKSIKSIIRMRFVESMPQTTWAMQAPSEYGFYANVNPEVDHPRWSQGKERRIGEFFRQETLMFNGYEEEVAHLYKDMDLRKFY